MKHELKFSPLALQDLDGIWEYITSDLGNPRDADKVVTAIMDTVDKLQEFPGMGAKLSSAVDMESDYRFVVSGHYMAFYRIGEGTVFIDRILYGRRNYLQALFNPDGGEK